MGSVWLRTRHMDTEAIIRMFTDEVKRGQEALQKDLAGVKDGVSEVKETVGRLDERVEHLREGLKDHDALEDRVRKLEHANSHRRGRDGAIAFALGAFGAGVTMFWDDALRFIRGL